MGQLENRVTEVSKGTKLPKEFVRQTEVGEGIQVGFSSQCLPSQLLVIFMLLSSENRFINSKNA